MHQFPLFFGRFKTGIKTPLAVENNMQFENGYLGFFTTRFGHLLATLTVKLRKNIALNKIISAVANQSSEVKKVVYFCREASCTRVLNRFKALNFR